MAIRRRHSESEIAAKLGVADEMAAQGMLHSNIAKSLGISLMTYHRWRKARIVICPTPGPARDAERADSSAERGQMSRIGDLQLENSRLRNLVTDLLLEKVKLTERLNGRDDAAVNGRGYEPALRAWRSDG
jgi:putative transposase